MSTKQNHYNEEFKRTLVELHQNGKSQSELLQGIRCFQISAF